MAGIYEHGESSCSNNEDFDIPPGFRFSPTDKEIMQYLTNKLKGSLECYDHIPVVDIYEHSPMELAAKYNLDGEGERYFFTPRSKKYPNGQRPDRFAKNGYWKPTSSGHFITDNGRNVGYVRTLKYFQGYEKDKSNLATIWLMQEYAPDNENFYNWAAVKIYIKRGASNKSHNVMVAENNLSGQEVEQFMEIGPSEFANQSPNQHLSFEAHYHSQLFDQTRSYCPTPKPIQIVEPLDQFVSMECMYNNLGHANHDPNIGHSGSMEMAWLGNRSGHMNPNLGHSQQFFSTPNLTEEVQPVAQAQPISTTRESLLQEVEVASMESLLQEVEVASMESFYNELGHINNQSYGNFAYDFNLVFSDQVNQAHLPLLQLPGLEEVSGANPPQFSGDQTHLKNQNNNQPWLDNVLEFLDPLDMISADQGEFSGLYGNSHL